MAGMNQRDRERRRRDREPRRSVYSHPHCANRCRGAAEHADSHKLLQQSALLAPPSGVTAHSVVTTVITAPTQLFKDPIHVSCSRTDLAAIAASQPSRSAS